MTDRLWYWLTQVELERVDTLVCNMQWHKTANIHVKSV